MKISYTLLLVCLMSCSWHCKSQSESASSEYPRWIEDIAFDEKLDNPDFEVCHGEDQVIQYFNLGDNIDIVGEKHYINEMFKEHYDPSLAKKESGLVRIRFLVNCKGETDRYRLLTGSLDYEEVVLDSSITDQLMAITKSLKGWKPKLQGEDPVDFYQFLVFRIIDGEIFKIMP